MRYIKPSWVIENKLESEQNLFSFFEIETEYISYTYICHCGKTKSVVGKEQPNYKCSCGNSTFLDLKEASKNFEKYISYLYFQKKIKVNFKHKFKIDIADNKALAICYVSLPLTINKQLNKVTYKDIIIASATPNKANKIKKVPKEYYRKQIEPKLKSMIENTEEFEKFITIKLSRKGSKIREKQVYFFLNHINLKDKEFFYWKHGDLLKGKELTIQKALIELANKKTYKSVKKAIFNNYKYQMKEFKKFNPMLIYLATSRLIYPNFIVDFINMKYINHDKFLTKLDRDKLFEFSDFLFQYYSHKQVIHFFRNFDNFLKMDNKNFKRSFLAFQDILRLYNILKHDLESDFKKVGCTPRRIHDQFSKILNLKKYKHLLDKKLTYTDKELKAQINIAEYSVKLPHNGAELYMWADTLSNCMASYLNELEKKLTIIYGFFMDDKIIFAVEIRNMQIWQAYRAYNKELTPYEKSLLSQWFKNFYLYKTRLDLTQHNFS